MAAAEVIVAARQGWGWLSLKGLEGSCGRVRNRAGVLGTQGPIQKRPGRHSRYSSRIDRPFQEEEWREVGWDGIGVVGYGGTARELPVRRAPQTRLELDARRRPAECR